MTTLAADSTVPNDAKFFRTFVTVMAAFLVGGFVLNLAMGRSSFAAPVVVHLHAVVFMGWVGIVLTQFWLAASGSIALHRQLGMLAVAWSGAMLVLGPWVTIACAQTGRVPFFFQPQHFVLADIFALAGFAAVFGAAVALRKRTDWHMRLQVCAFAMLTGPGFGRLLPMPFLSPYAFEAASVPAVLFIVFGMVRDGRAHGRAHPAWMWGIAALVATLALARVVGFSDLGAQFYAFITAGTALEGADGLAFPPPPGV
jgi:hypothetical protein